MNPSTDAEAVLPVEAPPEAPRGPQGDAGAAARLLPPWVWERCPHVKPDGRCRRVGGGCRLLGPVLRRCEWAEQGPALAAPEPVFRAYQAIFGPRRPACLLPKLPKPQTPQGPPAEATRPRRRRREAVAPRDNVPPNPYDEVERACVAQGQTVERVCPVCGERPLLPNRRRCDPCQAAARRATKRRAQRKWRGNRGSVAPV